MPTRGARRTGTFKDKGIVLREYAAGEADKRLLLLLHTRGRQMVHARGAGKPKSKFHACAQTFAFSEFVIYEGASFLSLAQCELIENFYGIRRDFERLCLAGHVLEMAGNILMPGMPCQDALRIIYITLSKLARADYPPKLAAVVFELKLLQTEGFLDKSIPGDFALSARAKAAVKRVLESCLKDVFSFALNEEEVLEVSKALGIFRREILGEAPKSLELLN